MNKIKAFLALTLLSGAILLTGCTKEEKTVGGVILGGAAGAGIGAAAGGGGGAVAGGAIGAVGGGLIGHSMGDDKDHKNKHHENKHHEEEK